MRIWLAAVSILGFLLVGALAASASIPSAEGIINGCYKISNGSVIVIDSEETCPSGYTALNWNQTGPAGPPGESSFQRVVLTHRFDAPQDPAGPITAVCPDGKQAVNGGLWEMSPEQAFLDAVANDPNPPGGVQYPTAFSSGSQSISGTSFPARSETGVTADGEGWTVRTGGNPAFYDGQFYATDVTIWVGCI